MPLTDAKWARMEPLLPDRMPRRGGRWRDHRELIDAIAWKFQTGSQWVHLSEKYGNWRGVYNRRGCGPWTAPGSGFSLRSSRRPTRGGPWTSLFWSQHEEWDCDSDLYGTPS
ncbi:transposase [Streptomyces sp. SAI-124]|uniref:transposase n=1 Tax=Streptomyces sp. SAI-124 TaxID=3377730 RepID=UPI003C7CA916